jgi:hypothetical protein
MMHPRSVYFIESSCGHMRHGTERGEDDESESVKSEGANYENEKVQASVPT